MKNLIFTSIFSLGLTMLTYAQSTPTPCDAPDSIKALYQDDADWLALERTLAASSIWQDSMKINPRLSQTMLKALLVVYNHPSLPARDTVTNILHIHSRPNPPMNEWFFQVQNSASWLDTFRQGLVNTGDTAFDSLITTFGLRPKLPILYNPEYSLVTLVSENNWNSMLLVPLLNSIEDISLAWPNAYLGVAPGDISARLMGTSVLLTYSHRWSIPVNFGCALGCPYRRYWRFQVDLSDCSVQYLGSFGDVLPQNYLSVKEKDIEPLQVYPNPFNTSINLKNIANGRAFRLYAYNGQLVRKGILEQNKIANLQDLPAGVYLLKIGDGPQAQQVSLVKK